MNGVASAPVELLLQCNEHHTVTVRRRRFRCQVYELEEAYTLARSYHVSDKRKCICFIYFFSFLFELETSEEGGLSLGSGTDWLATSVVNRVSH